MVLEIVCSDGGLVVMVIVVVSGCNDGDSYDDEGVGVVVTIIMVAIRSGVGGYHWRRQYLHQGCSYF